MGASRSENASVATVIGDIVGSRTAVDRQQVHDRLIAALQSANAVTTAVRPAWITAGDEFQGVYPDVGEALDAALLIRLAAHPVQIRFGLGWGRVTVLDDAGIQDGPGWWSARAALDQVAAAQGVSATRSVRTAFAAAPQEQDEPADEEAADVGRRPEVHTLNAALLCRDHLLGSMDERDLRILGGLLEGSTQAGLAAAEGISPSAVSQRIARSGIGVVMQAHELLRTLAVPSPEGSED